MQVNEASYFGSTVGAKQFILSPGCVQDAHVMEGAGISATKLVHRHRAIHKQAGNAATETVCLAVIRTGTTNGAIPRSIGVGVRTAGSGGGMSVTVDLQKNGTTILSGGPITINASTTAKTLVLGTLAASTLTTGDWIDAVITATAGGGTLPQGLYVGFDYDEPAT
jgi:hypothetical protein